MTDPDRNNLFWGVVLLAVLILTAGVALSGIKTDWYVPMVLLVIGVGAALMFKEGDRHD